MLESFHLNKSKFVQVRERQCSLFAQRIKYKKFRLKTISIAKEYINRILVRFDALSIAIEVGNWLSVSPPNQKLRHY